jgi:hypothetical protein
MLLCNNLFALLAATVATPPIVGYWAPLRQDRQRDDLVVQSFDIFVPVHCY